MADKDQKTLKLIQEVKKRQSEITKLGRPDWRTNCSFNHHGKPINLHVASDLSLLISIAAHVKAHGNNYSVAAKDIGVEDPPTFTYNGFSVEDWLSDIKTRVGQLQIKEKTEQLKKLQKRLDAIVSPELKAELELDAIMKELDG